MHDLRIGKYYHEFDDMITCSINLDPHPSIDYISRTGLDKQARQSRISCLLDPNHLGHHDILLSCLDPAVHAAITPARGARGS